MISDYMRENPEFEYIIDMGRDSYIREFNEWWGNYDWQGFGTTKFEGEILEEDWFIKIIRRYKNECNINNYKDFNRFSKLIYIFDKYGIETLEQIKDNQTQIDFFAAI